MSSRVLIADPPTAVGVGIGEPCKGTGGGGAAVRTRMFGDVAGSTVALAPKEARAAATFMSPSTRIDPYLQPSIAGVKTVSILTVGDSVGGYRMVGIPDGLGPFASGHDEFTLLMNHELTATPPSGPGVVRAHGSTGAFVSRWTIDARTLRVKKGQDHTPSPSKLFLWDGRGYVAGTTQWQRHCSGDLPASSAFYHRGRGTTDRIYMNGEEVTDGRAWARIASGPHTGEAWQLPRFGRMAYENAVACPYAQEKTIVALTDDSSALTTPLPNNGKQLRHVPVGKAKLLPRAPHGYKFGIAQGSLNAAFRRRIIDMIARRCGDNVTTHTPSEERLKRREGSICPNRSAFRNPRIKDVDHVAPRDAQHSAPGPVLENPCLRDAVKPVAVRVTLQAEQSRRLNLARFADRPATALLDALRHEVGQHVFDAVAGRVPRRLFQARGVLAIRQGVKRLLRKFSRLGQRREPFER